MTRPTPSPATNALPQTPDGVLLHDWLAPGALYGFAARRHVAHVPSRHQRIDVYDTELFGRLYCLDGHFMASERDAFICHECMVHPAALAHPAPRHALVLGGGDGGSARELLRHATIERVVVAELDEAVVTMTRQYLPDLADGAFDDARLALRIGDAHDTVARAIADGEYFDLVVFDLTAADGSASTLHSAAFFAEIRRVLSPQGIVALQLGAPWFHAPMVARLLHDLGMTFAHVRPMTAYVPLYGTLWAMATASATLDPAALDAAEVHRRLCSRGIDGNGLRYYGDHVHAALFALPRAVRERIAPSAQR